MSLAIYEMEKFCIMFYFKFQASDLSLFYSFLIIPMLILFYNAFILNGNPCNSILTATIM